MRLWRVGTTDRGSGFCTYAEPTAVDCLGGGASRMNYTPSTGLYTSEFPINSITFTAELTDDNRLLCLIREPSEPNLYVCPLHVKAYCNGVLIAEAFMFPSQYIRPGSGCHTQTPCSDFPEACDFALHWSTFDLGFMSKIQSGDCCPLPANWSYQLEMSLSGIATRRERCFSCPDIDLTTLVPRVTIDCPAIPDIDARILSLPYSVPFGKNVGSLVIGADILYGELTYYRDNALEPMEVEVRLWLIRANPFAWCQTTTMRTAPSTPTCSPYHAEVVGTIRDDFGQLQNIDAIVST